MSDEMGCLDGFCYIKGKAKGMHTNGGCKCVRNLVGRDNPAAAFALEKLLAELHNTIESLRTQPRTVLDAELVKDINNLMMDMNVSDVYGPGATEYEGKAYRLLDRCLVALTEQSGTEKDYANKIAKRLPIWMLDTYDKDSFSSMLSAVAYLKQQASNESGKVDTVRRECGQCGGRLKTLGSGAGGLLFQYCNKCHIEYRGEREQ